MSHPLPWDNISVPSSDLNRLLAAGNMVSPASWALDREGHRLFVIELAGDHQERYERDAVSVHGLRIDLRTGDQPGLQQLILTLESEQNVDLFAVLCRSLLEELTWAKSSASSLEITLTHLRRWKAFLANRNARILTSEEIRGLFAELWFLKDLANTALGPEQAASAWRGPDRIQQDFIFSGQAVEVKSLVSADPITVRISSENQLESGEPKLFLVVALLAEVKKDEGRSLNAIVSEVLTVANGGDAQLQLESKLAQCGYLPLPEYDRLVLHVVGTLTYEVSASFPRIVRSGLPPGVVRVAYQIQLEHLEPFKCELAKALGVA